MDPKTGWIQTYTGGTFCPADPRPADVHMEDLAHSLAMKCRFNGHCILFYSVAEHSVHLARHFLTCPAPHGQDQRVRLARYALLHDATEAYFIGDVPTPIKPLLGGSYTYTAATIQKCIYRRFGLGTDTPYDVKVADKAIVTVERDNLRPPAVPWSVSPDPLPGVQLEFWQPQQAEAIFMRVVHALWPQGPPPWPPVPPPWPPVPPAAAVA